MDIDASLAIQDLGRKGFDAAIRIGDGQWSGVQAQRIASGVVLPVATPELARQWQEAFDAGDPQIPLLEHDVAPWHSWFSAAGRMGGGQQLALFNDAGLLLRAAEQGFGIALVKAVLAQDAIAAGRLVPLAAALHLNDSDIYLAWPQAAGLTSEVAALLNWLQQQLN